MRIALIHDYLTQYGGAERVLEALHAMYPESEVFTSLYDPDHLPDSWRDWTIHESPLRLIPGARKTHRLWTPLYPVIFRRIGAHDLDGFDVVIADSSAWAHHAHPASGAPLICYCHSPARFLYGDRDYLGASRIPSILRPLAGLTMKLLRRVDVRAAHRVTTYIANSAETAGRIRRTYDLPARVVYPPIDTARFRPAANMEPEDWYLVVSRLVPHKYVDRAIRAANATGSRLKVIGTGRAEDDLRAMAGPTIEFLGEQSDDVVVDHMQRCRAFILPGVEDFGMTSPEAQAAGRPVFAMRGGGALETVVDGETGALFDDEDGLACLMSAPRSWDSAAIQRHADDFSTAAFEPQIRDIVNGIAAASREHQRGK